VYKYGYHRQAVHYTKPNGLDLHDDVFDFMVVAKSNARTRVYKTDSAEFAKKANDAFDYGIKAMLDYLKYGVRYFYKEKL
jgi:hypothetical protein